LTSSQADWVESLDPWPEEFGLDRMRALVADLGEPQRAFRSIHVVGTNGKSTAARTIAALLEAEGLRAGAYTSPHVRSWAERILVDGQEADFERAIARVRRPAESVGATQFEVLTAAALAEFREARVEVAAIEAGLGGRLDATNVVDAQVVLLTNVALEHTDVLGDTPQQIAKEKLAVAHASKVVVLPDNTFAHLVPPKVRTAFGGAREAAEAFLERRVDREVQVALPGRFERRGEDVWDGAHTPEAVEWLLERLPRRDYVLCVSILREKDVDGILRRLSRAGRTLVATESSNRRTMPAGELADRAAPHFDRVDAIDDAESALARAHEIGGAVLVTGSLYLLADLYSRE
jgi:dihydrofolate synthase/folylpolyglutamate synthase